MRPNASSAVCRRAASPRPAAEIWCIGGQSEDRGRHFAAAAAARTQFDGVAATVTESGQVAGDHTAAYRMARDPQMPLTDVQWVLGHAHLSTRQRSVASSAPAIESLMSACEHTTKSILRVGHRADLYRPMTDGLFRASRTHPDTAHSMAPGMTASFPHNPLPYRVRPKAHPRQRREAGPGRPLIHCANRLSIRAAGRETALTASGQRQRKAKRRLSIRLTAVDIARQRFSPPPGPFSRTKRQ